MLIYRSFFKEDIDENVDSLCESVKKKKVVRDNKITSKYCTDREGYKITYDDSGHPKETKMDSSERNTRKKSAKISARHAKTKQGTAARKRAKSDAKRTWESIELTEAWYSFDKDKALNYIWKLCKKFNGRYKMLHLIDNNRDGLIDLHILYPDNKKGILTIDLQDQFADIIKNDNPSEYFPYRKGQFIKVKDFITRLDVVCKYCYDRVYNNAHNHIDRVDYSKLRFV